MAESRRSGRSRKEVDYTAFGGGDDSDDGDFTEPTPPPAKKPREDREKSKKTKKKRSSKDVDEDFDEFKETPRGKRKERKPIEDRMFDRELELALEMSRADSSQETSEGDGSPVRKKMKEVSAVVHTAPASIQESVSPMAEELQENRSPVKQQEPEEESPSPPQISLSNMSPVKAASAKKSPTATKKAKTPTASAAKQPLTSNSAKKTLATGAGKQPTGIAKGGPLKKLAPPPRTKTTMPSVPKTKSNITMASPRTVALKRPVTSPSASCDSGNNPLGGVKLVSSGVPIRLGLSKFARVKPLHSNVKV